jgi:hypothetical protein
MSLEGRFQQIAAEVRKELHDRVDAVAAELAEARARVAELTERLEQALGAKDAGASPARRGGRPPKPAAADAQGDAPAPETTA